MKSINTQLLLDLVRFHWSIPVLALLVQGTTGVSGKHGGGGKFVTLVQRANISPGSLKRTLDALIKQGWVRRNPGYGHPMRPEYVLTPRGMSLARAAEGVMAVLLEMDVSKAALRKWSLPVTLALGTSKAHFGEIQKNLPGITPRALALALKELEVAGLVERKIVEAYPPRPRYELTPSGQVLGGRARQLERALAA